MLGNGQKVLAENLSAAQDETAMRMRTHDWSKTLLAKGETRLQRWKTIVGIAKASSQLTCIGWGKEAINYRNNYRTVLGGRVSNTPAKSYCVCGVTFHCSLPELQQEAQ